MTYKELVRRLWLVMRILAWLTLADALMLLLVAAAHAGPPWIVEDGGTALLCLCCAEIIAIGGAPR
jgi:hypothetical protein